MTAAQIADLAMPHYFDDFDLADYIADTDAALPIRARLLDALDRDIHDLIHNANLDLLIPTDDMTDATFDAIIDDLLAAPRYALLDALCSLLADRLLA
jgi:hypothetical protein